MISLLEIENFKCFGSQAIPFGSITLLSGLNGSGKSTVIQALLLLRQSFQQRFLPETGLSLNGELTEIGSAQDALFEGAEAEEIGFRLALNSGAEGKWRFAYDRSADVLKLSNETDVGRIYSSTLFKDGVHFLSAERIGPRAAFTMADYVVNRQRQLGIRGEYAAHFLSAYGNEPIPISALKHPAGKSMTLLHQTEAWLSSVSPGVRLYVTPFHGIDTVQLQYSFIVGEDESNRYRPTNVGFGLTYTLPVIVALLASKPGDLVIIENAEAHLHGQGQRVLGELASLVACNGVQVILETHSDHILNGVRIAVYQGKADCSKAVVHFFTRRSKADGIGHVVISPTIDRDGRLRGSPEGFFDEWDRSLETLLTPKPAK